MSSAVVARVVIHCYPFRIDAAQFTEQVLDFVQALDGIVRRGVASKQLLKFAGVIDAADLQLMSQAIEERCGQVNLTEW